MEIKKILYVEDNTGKYMDIASYLKRIGFSNIEWVRDAEKAVEALEKADIPYDLLLFDMHFDFFGEDDQEAGEKLMNLMREKGYETPVIFCSSENWKIPGSFGTIYYNPRRNWEDDAKDLFNDLKKL